ncbi:hypothetical protein [Sinimarinibacterium thermocellulolyticum]|uniref:Uncharacterized protein n=1 Tax=Sinimarinibacterium thermocellulolyticum TaxID=3170016 RepID=A0ABV2A9F4_9GAMM
MTMSTSPRWPRRLLAFVGALLIAAAWGAIVQTQFNLQQLLPFVDIPLRVRLQTTLHDLAAFGSLYALMLLVAWLPAFVVAMWLARRWPGVRTPLYALAAGVAVVVAIRATDAAVPPPVLIDATRSLAGLLAMAAGCVIGGALFAHWTRPAD